MESIFGKQIGRYILLEKLGEGGMAAVYNAYDSRLERNVALKIILPSRQHYEMFLERFVVEAKALAQLAHTNIVKVLDYGDDNGVPYLVMEYIQGGTLKEMMGHPHAWTQAAAILAPIARALDYVHKQKIVHRDVKPSNILIDENDQPMLSDFGVVKLLEVEESEAMAATGVGIGTPDYMSPEQGMGKEVDYRADIYALGVVFYEMVTGQKPFTADTPMAIIIQHATGSIPRPRLIVKEVPRVVEDVIMKAVARDPSRRFKDMAEFAEMLEQLARGERADWVRIRRVLRRKEQPKPVRLLLWASLLLALLSAGTAAILFWNDIGRLVGGYPVAWDASTAPTPTLTIPESLPSQTPPPPTQTPVVVTVIAATSTLNPTPAPPVKKATEAPPEFQPALLSTPVIYTGKPLNANLAEIARWGLGGVNDAAWSPEGNLIALATTDGIYVYHAQNLELALFINTHLNMNDTDNWVNVISFTPDGKYVIAGMQNGHVRVWSASTGRYEREYLYKSVDVEAIKTDRSSPVTALGFSPNERYLAIGYQNGVIHVWRQDTQKIETTCYQYDTVSSLIFTNDIRYILAARNSRVVYKWDISSPGKPRSTELQFTSSISKLYSQDGRFMFAGGGSSSAVMYDLAEDRVLYTYNLNTGITHIAVSPDSQQVLLAASDGKIRIYPYPNLVEWSSTLAETGVITAHQGPITALAFSSDGKRILSTSWTDRLIVWDAETFNEIQSLKPPFNAIEQMVFSPDGMKLIVQEVGGNLLFLNVNSGKVEYTYAGILPEGKLFSPDGNYMVFAEVTKNVWENGVLKILHIDRGEIIQSLPDWPRSWQVGFSPDGNLFVTGSMQSALIWDISTWQKIRIHGGPNSGCGQFFTPNNELLVVIAAKGVVFKEFKDDKKLQVYCGSKPDFGFPLVLINDDQTAIFKLNAGGLWVWNLTVSEVTISRTRRYLYGDHYLGASPDSSYIASAGDDLRLVKNYTYEICRLPSYAAYEYRTAISADNQVLAVGSKFGVIRLLVNP
jgi:serine/threonine protein kinase/WD40 repeat protein